jgi:hypothetical protein
MQEGGGGREREKREGGAWEHPGQGDLRETFKPVVPPLHRAGGLRCSVARLTPCPPLQDPRRPTLRPGATGHSMFGAGRPSTRPRRPIPGAPSPHPPSPARVTGGRYPAQMSKKAPLLPYIPSASLPCNAYGFLCVLLCAAAIAPHSFFPFIFWPQNEQKFICKEE